ncbi:hypothetical protein AO366_0619 [Moraxella catarrhalis]|nr:hypothetical protein AO379_0207 [Moraxella catarrhalis]OAV19405.1 hypothetical protein AO373_0631 [Moraxella catarrhalis]OAV35193.1 hypothetical protein AO366_0619 [Moraxella catarrhalis]
MYKPSFGYQIGEVACNHYQPKSLLFIGMVEIYGIRDDMAYFIT